MPFSADELAALLRQYQAAVQEAVQLLRRHDFSTTLLAIYRSGPLDQDRARYAFHGVGCLVTLPDGRHVDFDFGFDERHDEARVDMLDPGFVQAYYEQLPGPATDSVAMFLALKAGMEALARAGVLVQPDADYPRFYFATDWHDPQPATFSPGAVLLDADEPAMLAQLDRFCYRLY